MITRYIGVQEPPTHEVMPAFAQDLTLLATGFIVLILFFVAIRNIFSRRDDSFLILTITPAFMVVAEGIAACLVRVCHPPNGAYVLYRAFGITVPAHMIFCYILMFTLTASFLLKIFRKDSSQKTYWISFVVTAVFCMVFEFIPVNVGLWYYWDNHPFVLLGFPVGIAIPNATGVFVYTAVAYFCLERLKGLKRYWLLFYAPLIYVGTYMAISYGTGVTLHSDAGMDVTTIGTVTTNIVSLVVVAHLYRLMLLIKNCKKKDNEKNEIHK